MKEILFICLSFSIIISKVNAQIHDTISNRNTHKVDANSIFQKSKNQKTAAWILLGGGTSTSLIGGLIAARGFFDFFTLQLDEADKNFGLAGVLMLTGSTAMLGSIPFFIASSKNKKKALSLSFKNETAPQFYKQSIVSLPLPSLTLKLNL